MSTLTPHRLTIHDVISFLDTQAIREETRFLIMPKDESSYHRDIQLKKTRTAQLLLRMAKEAAATKEPNTLLSLLHNLPNE